jgi:hypothetical protein
MADNCFVHSGDLGDIIYSLPAIRACGGGKLYLSPGPGCRELMTQARADVIAPLLRAQDYITGVEFSAEPKDHALNRFRALLKPGMPLADAHLLAVNKPLSERDRPWLTVSPLRPPYPVLFVRSPRYRNPLFDWQRVYDAYYGQAAFVGLYSEWQMFETEFGPIPYLYTADLMDLARYIAGSELIVCNQSCPASIAHGLHARMLLEVDTTKEDCTYARDGVVLSRCRLYRCR